MFVLTSLLAVAVIGFVGVQVLKSEGRREAVADAKDLAVLAGRGIVQPSLSDRLVGGDPAAIAALDRVVRASVLGPRLVRVKVFAADGRVLYSDARALIGDRYPLAPQERAALASGAVVAEQRANLSAPQNRFERGFRSLLEIYLPVHTKAGTKLLFEAYLPTSEVSASARNLWVAFAPALFGGLLLLELVLVPLGWSLARRVRRGEQQRTALLAHAVEASQEERRRIARDLHDGVVQDLAGVALSLASAETKAASADRADADVLRQAATQTRQSIRALRSLLVEIYPPNLRSEGLRSALSDLLEGLKVRGLRTELEFDPGLSLSEENQALFYRVAQETVRNVLNHARANTVEIAVIRSGADGAVLSISDDGVGFAAERLEQPAEDGHVGLGLLADLLREHAGRLDISSAPGHGTTLRAEVPLR
jgi:two-component system, NarL family, sensor kinase